MPRIRISKLLTYASFLLLIAAAFLFLSPSPRAVILDNYDEIASDLYNGSGSKGKDDTARRADEERQKPWIPYFSGSGAGAGAANAPPRLGLEFSRDGLVRGWDKVHSVLKSGAKELKKKDRKRLLEVGSKHPIEELMKRGQKKWESLLERSVAFTLPVETEVKT